MDVTIEELYNCYPVSNHIGYKLYLMKAQIFELNKVIVKNSKIHGKGVFAKRKIKTREIITFYPADILIISEEGEKHAIYDEKYNVNDILKFDNYKYDIDKFLSIIGDPRKDKNMSYVGHLINDVYNKCENYEINSINANAVFLVINNLVVVIANKEIEDGEEILVNYGLNYWKCRNK